MARDDEPRKLKRPLPVKLTDDELKKKGKKAGHLKKVIEEIKAEMKAAVSGHKEKLKEKTAELGALLDELDAGTEDRKVDCHEIRDFLKKEVRIVRLDTGDVVERRTMAFEELQGNVPGTEPEDGEPSDGDGEDEDGGFAGELPEKPKRGRKKK